MSGKGGGFAVAGTEGRAGLPSTVSLPVFKTNTRPKRSLRFGGIIRNADASVTVVGSRPGLFPPEVW